LIASVKDELKIPRHRYVARMLDRRGNREIERIFDDPEAAIRYAKDNGLEIKTLRRYGFKERGSRSH